MLAAISPMIIWAIYFAITYSVQGLGCVRGWDAGALTGALLVMSVVALKLIGWIGIRAWPRRASFEGRVMGVLALLAGIATILNTLPILLLHPCTP